MSSSQELLVPSMSGLVDATAVVGLMYGDEGKGKIIAHEAPNFDYVVRANGGANAGHTFCLPDGTEVNTHQLPSGITQDGIMNVIAHGAFVDPVRLVEEIKTVEGFGISITPDNLAISSMSQLVLPHHKLQDALREGGDNSQGTTKAGIAFVASDMALREGLRGSAATKESDELFKLAIDRYNRILEARYGVMVPEVEDQKAEEEAARFVEAVIQLRPFIRNTIDLIRRQPTGTVANVLLEGAQAFGLDMQRGKWPYVTSSGTTALDLAKGTGLNHLELSRVIGVTKVIPSQVGGGSFVTKINDGEIAAIYRGSRGSIDGEYGKTTQRERNIGYLDLVMLRAATEANGVSELAITKLDVLSRRPTTKIAISYDLDGETITSLPATDEELAACKPNYVEMPTNTASISGETDYARLPQEIKDIVNLIQDYTDTKVRMLGTGPRNADLIVR
jgi:adenylosuccinate synthase